MKAATHWQSSLIKDSTESLSYVTSKSLEGFMYGNMSSGNLQFDLKSYSAGVDYPLTFVNASRYSTDTIPPMIYIPNVISSDGSRGGKTKVVTLSKNIGGQVLDQSGIEEIMINGHSVTFSQNGKFNLDQNFSREWTKLVITARDRMGNTASDSFIVNMSKEKLADPQDLDESQTYRALLFGTNEYDTWDDLKNPISDVTKIATLLKEKYGFEVSVQMNKTVEQIDSTIKAYSKMQYASKDHLLVFFAGHGHYDPSLGGHIVGKNSDMGGSLRSYLRFNDIRDLLSGNSFGCQHTMLVFDVCFGGTFYDKNNVINYSESSILQIKDSTEKWIKEKLEIPSAFFITSGSKEYVPDESQFALKFIETLESNGTNKGYILTFDDFTDNLQTLSFLPKDKNPTTPRFGTYGNHKDKGEFIMVYKKPNVIVQKPAKTQNTVNLPSKEGQGAIGSKQKK